MHELNGRAGRLKAPDGTQCPGPVVPDLPDRVVVGNSSPPLYPLTSRGLGVWVTSTVVNESDRPGKYQLRLGVRGPK